MEKHSQKFLQQRRFYMVLPLLVVPFITLAFWALGGGQGTPSQVSQTRPGLNLTLPGAHFDKEDELWDKFTLYEQAKRDSMQYEEARRNDPYYVVATLKGNASDTVPKANGLNTSLGSKDKYKQINEHETLINKKLAQLTEQLSAPESKTDFPGHDVPVATETTPSKQPDPEVDRLEQMMALMSSGEQSDPEMEQIDGMLDKILDIQHPDRVRQKNEASEMNVSPQAFAVEVARRDDNISTVEPNQGKRTELLPEVNGFYGMDDEPLAVEQSANAIQAVIHESQEVVSGSTVKLRLLSDVTINEKLIGKNQFIYGICNVSGERLMIDITSIRDEHSLYPVSLKAFDLDGIEGVYIPGAIARDAAKQASGQSLQGMQFLSMDTSLGAQAAAAGIEATKGLLGKKAKLIKITLKAGYQVLLKDKNQSLR